LRAARLLIRAVSRLFQGKGTRSAQRPTAGRCSRPGPRGWQASAGETFGPNCRIAEGAPPLLGRTPGFSRSALWEVSEGIVGRTPPCPEKLRDACPDLPERTPPPDLLGNRGHMPRDGACKAPRDPRRPPPPGPLPATWRNPCRKAFAAAYRSSTTRPLAAPPGIKIHPVLDPLRGSRRGQVFAGPRHHVRGLASAMVMEQGSHPGAITCRPLEARNENWVVLRQGRGPRPPASRYVRN